MPGLCTRSMESRVLACYPQSGEDLTPQEVSSGHTIRLLDYVPLLLARQEELEPIVCKVGIVLLHHINLLVVPLGNRSQCIQLDRHVGAISQAFALVFTQISAFRGSEVDLRSQAVPLIADRMTINLGFNSLLPGLLHSLFIDFTGEATGPCGSHRERIL